MRRRWCFLLVDSLVDLNTWGLGHLQVKRQLSARVSELVVIHFWNVLKWRRCDWKRTRARHVWSVWANLMCMCVRLRNLQDAGHELDTSNRVKLNEWRSSKKRKVLSIVKRNDGLNDFSGCEPWRFVSQQNYVLKRDMLRRRRVERGEMHTETAMKAFSFSVTWGNGDVSIVAALFYNNMLSAKLAVVVRHSLTRLLTNWKTTQIAKGDAFYQGATESP